MIPLRAGPVVMPSHTVGRHAHQAVATGYHSLGSAWPTVSRSGRRIASARQSRGGNHGILGGNGETPPGALGLRTLSGAPRTVVVSCRPLCPFRGHLDDWDGQRPEHVPSNPVYPQTSYAPKVRMNRLPTMGKSR